MLPNQMRVCSKDNNVVQVNNYLNVTLVNYCNYSSLEVRWRVCQTELKANILISAVLCDKTHISLTRLRYWYVMETSFQV